MIHWGMRCGVLEIHGTIRRELKSADLRELMFKGALFGRIVIDGQEISGPVLWRLLRDAASVLAESHPT